MSDQNDLETCEENKYLTFVIGKEIYGISILSVVEIIRCIDITNIPASMPFIKGVINLRDKIIPVMSIGVKVA